MNNQCNSNGGQQNIAQGTGAIGQVNNNYATPQVPVPVEELLTLLAEIKAQSLYMLVGLLMRSVRSDI